MISRMKKTLWFPVTLALCALMLWVVQGVGLTLFQVRGLSMAPSYADGQILFVNRLAYGLQGPIIGDYLWIWKAPRVGDAVVAKNPSGTWVVKRVAGLPGMPITVTEHRIAVGQESAELSASQEYWLNAVATVPSDSVFVLGDNRPRSQDSRDWGFIPVKDIVGSPLF